MPLPSGQQTRYDASALTGLSNNDSVTSWPSAVNGYTGVPGSAGTYKTAISVSGLPIVRFANNWYDTSGASAQAGAHTIAAVIRPSGSGTARTIMGSTGGFGPIQVRVESDNKLGLVSTGRVFVGASPSPLSTTDFSVIVVTGSNTGWKMRINGTEVNSGGGVDFIWSGNRRLGASAGGTESFVGDMAEVITWESVLDSTGITSTETYLSDKWLTAPAPTTISQLDAINSQILTSGSPDRRLDATLAQALVSGSSIDRRLDAAYAYVLTPSALIVDNRHGFWGNRIADYV